MKIFRTLKLNFVSNFILFLHSLTTVAIPHDSFTNSMHLPKQKANREYCVLFTKKFLA